MRKFTRSCSKGGTCLVDVIISEYACGQEDFTRKDILTSLSSLKLTPRQASYRLAHLVKNGTLTMTGKGGSSRYHITARPVGMTHRMNLHSGPFRMIKAGQKTVEMRLNDEKRRLISVGDFILFTNIKTKEELFVKVIGKHVYNDFTELYKHHDKVSIGYLEDEPAHPDDMLAYYTEENINKHGALALVISLKTD